MWDVETDQIFKVPVWLSNVKINLHGGLSSDGIKESHAIVLKVKPSYLKKVNCVNDTDRCWVSAIACNWLGNRSFRIERNKLITIPVSDLPLYLNFPYIEPIFFNFIKEGDYN